MGKSLLFENPILSTCYNFCSAQGVGRFNCDNVNLVLCHDISLSVLVNGTDGEVFRCLARAEVAKVKIHSSEKALEPLFVLITSNQNVHRHVFKATSPSGLPDIYPAQLVPSKNKLHLSESYLAMQNRILELFVRTKPAVPIEALPEPGTVFERQHSVLGLFERVMCILVKNPPDHFVSNILVSYCVSALFHNVDYFCHVFAYSDYSKGALVQVLNSLKSKFGV